MLRIITSEENTCGFNPLSIIFCLAVIIIGVIHIVNKISIADMESRPIIVFNILGCCKE